MIFLKKFEARGFKSFADYTKLNFDSSLIGIVGPNGAGKSNVIDAVKWVLGEKSIKSLRGKKSDDIIFHGSKSKNQSDFAEVTLTFDNSKRMLQIDCDEISVTRKLFRGNGNNEYYINGEISRLKDIHDIFTDTGLSKGSLGIISQGTVNWFADSKPEERRTIFEEAAGIGKYTRKREESLRQLERTQANLNRIIDISREISRNIKKLESQASKAKEYSEKKEELAYLEISMLVKDINYAQGELDKIRERLTFSRNVTIELEPKISQLSELLLSYKDSFEKTDIKISRFSNEMIDITNKINELELKKNVYENEVSSFISSGDYNTKIEGLSNAINLKERDLSSKKNILIRNEKELEEYVQQVKNLKSEKEILDSNLIELVKEISEKRVILQTQIDFLNSKPNYSAGAKAILGNVSALTGILGSVLDFVKCEKEHEKAISIALGKNVQNIVVNTSRDIKRAIDFLVKNKAGVATFMPIYEMKPKEIKDEHKEILLQLPGVVGIASELVTADKKIKPIFDVLLGRIIIATDFESATNISKYTFMLYKIITLDGQIINPQGTVTGGFTKQVVDTMISAEKKIKELKISIKNSLKEVSLKEKRVEEINLLLIDLENKTIERKINVGGYSNEIKIMENDLIWLKAEYQKLSKKDFDSADGSTFNLEQLVDRLNSLYSTKDKVQNELTASENSKREIKSKMHEIEDELERVRTDKNSNMQIVLDFDRKEGDLENIINNSKKTLNETYQMTIESALEKFNKPIDVPDKTARQKIERLKKELSYIGSINMDAVAELEAEKQRYEKMRKDEEEITKAKDDILQVISELDNKAHEDFQKTIIKINEELPNTFRYLFGGGSCSIEFTDSTDILNSGIDVKASPPGKHVNSLFALSGGEKTLVALSVLFTILKISSFPLVILDEAESALDPSNVERFGNIISNYSTDTQFLVITHRPGTMERCEKLYGATMQIRGITSMYQVKVQEAKQYASDNESIKNSEE